MLQKQGKNTPKMIFNTLIAEQFIAGIPAASSGEIFQNPAEKALNGAHNHPPTCSYKQVAAQQQRVQQNY